MPKKTQTNFLRSIWTPFALRRIDTYYVRFYLKAFFLILFALAALVAIGDLFQKFDDFVVLSRREEQDFMTMVMTFARYYVSFVPQLIFQYMFPVVMLLAASITVTSSFAGPRGNNEYIVIRSSGIPVLRAFVPLLIPALAIAILFQASRDFFLPGIVRQSAAINNRLKSRTSNPTSVSMIGPDGFQTAAIGYFAPDGVGHNMILEVRDPERFHRGDARHGDNDFVAYRAAAARLEAGPDGRYQWVPLENARKQTYSSFARREVEWTEPVRTTMTPAMIERQTLGDSVSSWRDLFLLRGDNAGARFEIHWRLADPMCGILLILWGTGTCMGLMLRGRSASLVHSISVSMVAGVLFYVLRLAGRTVWESGMASPEMGVWGPVGVAVVVAVCIAAWMER
jgi:Predicted permeases